MYILLYIGRTIVRHRKNSQYNRVLLCTYTDPKWPQWENLYCVTATQTVYYILFEEPKPILCSI